MVPQRFMRCYISWSKEDFLKVFFGVEGWDGSIEVTRIIKGINKGCSLIGVEWDTHGNH
jgi:hypothetical protein